MKVHYHEQNTCHWTSHPVSIRSMLILFVHHTCISQVVYFREVWQPKFCMHFLFPLFIHFARFHLIFMCQSLKEHYLLSSKINMFSDFGLNGSSILEQNYVMKVFVFCICPENLNGVVKWKWVRCLGYVTHKGSDKCEKFCSEIVNIRDNLGELGRIKRTILKLILSK